MSTTANMHDAAEQIANAVFGTAPTPEAIDEMAKRYLEAKAESAAAEKVVSDLALELTGLVKDWGAPVPNAEQSRRLNGRLATLTVTKSNSLTIIDANVETLKDALFVNGYGAFFGKLFTERKKWEVVDGAQAALKAESLPKRLSEKVLNLWGRCISVKPKKPSLQVTLADPARPAKKAKKAGK